MLTVKFYKKGLKKSVVSVVLIETKLNFICKKFKLSNTWQIL